MDLSTFRHVFLSLVLLQVVAAHVEPPNDVILHCHNLHNVVKWNYGQSLPDLKFRVDIGTVSRPPSELWVHGSKLEADVSFLSDPSDDYYLTVTAVIGQNESDPAPQEGIFFSYFMDSPSHQKCVVDFPPVNVTAQQDGSVLFNFMHPWLLYHQRMPGSRDANRRKKKSHAEIINRLPEFTYDVETVSQREHHERFSCEQSVCEGKLLADPAQEKHCLKVRGEMQKILFQATQQYCALPLETTPADRNDYIYIIIIVVVALALIAVFFIFFMVYKKKTKPSSSFPNSMTFTSRLRQWTLGVPRDPVSVPEVEPTSPTYLLSTTEDNEDTGCTPVISSTETDFRLPIGVPADDEGVCDDVEVSDGEGRGYMPGNLDEDETQVFNGAPSDYEKRPVFVELAPDEQAEGYRS